MIPISRVEMYLAKICGEDVELPIPQTRKEVFLAIIAGESYEKPVPSSRVELYLAKILGDDVPLPIPQSREEIFLAAIAGVEYPLPYPESRIEYWLHKWATYEEWSTISGNPVSFTAKAAPLRQLKVAFSPVQSLHGYDSPWPAGGGKNKFDIDHPLYTAGSQGIIDNYCCKVEDGKLYNGGVAGNTPGASITIPVIAEQTYTFSFTINGEKASWEIRAVTLDGVLWTSNTVLTRSLGPQTGAITATVTIPSGHTHLYLACFSSTKYGSWETDIQLELGSSASAWTPYSNICPISGWSSLTVEQRGKNLAHIGNAPIDETHNGCRLEINGASGHLSGTSTVTSGTLPAGYANHYVELPAGTYTLSSTNFAESGCYLRARWDVVSGSTIVNESGAPNGYTFTLTSSRKLYITVGVYGTNAGGFKENVDFDFEIQIELGNEKTDYAPYNPSSRSISISLGQTVYSGYVDVVTGVGEVTMVSVEYDGSEDENWTRHTSGSAGAFAMSIPINPLFDYPFGAVDTIRSNYLRSLLTTDTWGLYSNFISANSASALKMGVKSIDTVEAWKAYLAEHPLTVCYKIATPIPIQLTPQEVESLAGDNVVWSTANGDLTVEYRSN